MQSTKAFTARMISATLAAAIALGITLPGRQMEARATTPQSQVGGRIVFDSGGEIYTVNPDGSGLYQLTHDGPSAHDRQPALSPDGSLVAFSSNRGGAYSIYIVGVDGTGLRRLTNNTDDDGEPVWSPDGARIAFVRGLDPTNGGYSFVSTYPSQVFVVNADGSEEINLTVSEGGTDPAWSPDGTRLAFASHRDGNFEIYSMTSDGKEVTRLTETESDEAEPAWSPDGTLIAYAGGYIRVCLSCGFMHTGRIELPVENGPDIFLMSADGQVQTRLTSKGNSSEPAWSPDGQRIAFASRRGEYAQLYFMELDGSHQTEVTSGVGHKSSPSWANVSLGAAFVPR